MEDGLAGPRLGAAAEARARPGMTLRPFAPFSGAAEADEGGGDWSFIDCEMEEVDLQDLPSATIACHLDPRVFVDGLCRVRAGRGGRRAEGGHLLPGEGSAEVRAGPGQPLQPGPRRGGRPLSGTRRRPRPPCRGSLCSGWGGGALPEVPGPEYLLGRALRAQGLVFHLGR